MSVHWISWYKKNKTALWKKIILAQSARRSQGKVQLNIFYKWGFQYSTQTYVSCRSDKVPSLLALRGPLCTQGVRCFLISKASHRNCLYPGGESELQLLDVPRGFLRAPGGLMDLLFCPKPCFFAKEILFWMFFVTVYLLCTNFALPAQDLNLYVDIQRNDCSWSDHFEWVLHLSCRNGHIGSEMSIFEW